MSISARLHHSVSSGLSFELIQQKHSFNQNQYTITWIGNPPDFLLRWKYDLTPPIADVLGANAHNNDISKPARQEINM
jgi:hypothetical protein